MKNQWDELQLHSADIKKLHLRDLFFSNKNRFFEFSIIFNDLLWDYSKQRVTHETMIKLCQLAESANLSERIEALFQGSIVNATEKRPALHTALRDFSHSPLQVNNQDIHADIEYMREKLYRFSESIRNQCYQGSTKKPISDILSLGIGGSDLGPRMASEALEPYKTTDLNFHFLSNVDGYSLENILKKIDPQTTICIVNSKTFTTPETLLNAKTILSWFASAIGQKPALENHFVAVTANKEKALAWGIAEDHIFAFWDWVGGRYSIWSAVGLSLLLAIGKDHYADFLAGAYEADLHFRHTPFLQNIPVLMGLLGVWNTNFFDCQTHAVLPYCDRLQLLPNYLQQLEMESNGKQLCLNNQYCHTMTNPIIWGGVGCDGQHAYMQLLHQSPITVPVDFLLPFKSHHPFVEQQELLIKSCLVQSQALMEGITEQELYDELSTQYHDQDFAYQLAKARMCPGNRPSSIFLFPTLDPRMLGTILAFYEHKVFVQSVIWNINPFDQWGVELGKSLMKKIDTITHHQTLDGCSGILEFLKRF